MTMEKIVKKYFSNPIPIHVLESSEHCISVDKNNDIDEKKEVEMNNNNNDNQQRFLPKVIQDIQTLPYDRFVPPVDKNNILPSKPFL